MSISVYELDILEIQIVIGMHFQNSFGKKIKQVFNAYSVVLPAHAPTTPSSLLASLFSYVYPPQSLLTIYAEESLLILSHSRTLRAAIDLSDRYNIPLMQIVINSKDGEEIVRSKILLEFGVSNVGNLNFVSFGDWRESIEGKTIKYTQIPSTNQTNINKKQENIQELEQKTDSQDSYGLPKEGIFFRKGRLVYAYISLKQIQINDPATIQQNLLKIRDNFYRLHADAEDKPNTNPQPKQNEEQQIPEQIPQEYQGNPFNQSDEQYEDEYEDEEMINEDEIIQSPEHD